MLPRLPPVSGFGAGKGLARASLSAKPGSSRKAAVRPLASTIAPSRHHAKHVPHQLKLQSKQTESVLVEVPDVTLSAGQLEVDPLLAQDRTSELLFIEGAQLPPSAKCASGSSHLSVLHVAEHSSAVAAVHIPGGDLASSNEPSIPQVLTSSSRSTSGETAIESLFNIPTSASGAISIGGACRAVAASIPTAATHADAVAAHSPAPVPTAAAVAVIACVAAAVAAPDCDPTPAAAIQVPPTPPAAAEPALAATSVAPAPVSPQAPPSAPPPHPPSKLSAASPEFYPALPYPPPAWHWQAAAPAMSMVMAHGPPPPFMYGHPPPAMYWMPVPMPPEHWVQHQLQQQQHQAAAHGPLPPFWEHPQQQPGEQQHQHAAYGMQQQQQHYQQQQTVGEHARHFRDDARAPGGSLRTPSASGSPASRDASVVTVSAHSAVKDAAGAVAKVLERRGSCTMAALRRGTEAAADACHVATKTLAVSRFYIQSAAAAAEAGRAAGAQPLPQQDEVCFVPLQRRSSSGGGAFDFAVTLASAAGLPVPLPPPVGRRNGAAPAAAAAVSGDGNAGVAAQPPPLKASAGTDINKLSNAIVRNVLERGHAALQLAGAPACHVALSAIARAHTRLLRKFGAAVAAAASFSTEDTTGQLGRHTVFLRLDVLRCSAGDALAALCGGAAAGDGDSSSECCGSELSGWAGGLPAPA